MKIVEVNIKREINISKEVILWNYWDHEHLDVVHGGYNSSDILYEKKNVLLRLDLISVPIFSFIKFQTPVFMCQEDEETLYVYGIHFGSIVSRTIIKVRKIEKEKSEIDINYKFCLKGWYLFLLPILKKLIYKWNQQTWIEDLPLKERRQKVLKLNFRDFRGLPDNVDERVYDGELEFKIPVPRQKTSSKDQHPLNNKN
jgi:hypothetical protein